MASQVWKPDVVVGVDFGMTSTGVAFSMGPEWARPETIQHWPGLSGAGRADKVKTAIAYDIHNENIANWGFAVDPEDRNCRIEELFKLHLDPDYKDGFRNAPTLEEARKWFTDFLSCVFKAIDRYFNASVPEWNSKNVEFVFSVPTTWRNPAMIAETLKLIRKAGFGDRSNHKVEITLTEAEAAAVYVSKNNYQRGDVFLVCDAGGGTTDVNILKMASSTVGQTELTPLLWVEGRPIGSALIDFKIEKLLTERLEGIRYHLESEPRVIAERMMRDKFESFKCNFGDEAMDVPRLPLAVPGLRNNIGDFPAAKIENAKMIITRDELQNVFDYQIEKIFKLVDEQLKILKHTYPNESVRYLVLSGGLGSSPYLQEKLTSRYRVRDEAFPGVTGITILKAPKPQLAVVHGLVMDRVQQIRENKIVYKKRCCRNSYGIIVRQLYNPAIHQGEIFSEDPRDKRKWAEKQIHWFIKQGQTIAVRDGVKHHYNLKIDPGKERLPWKTHIVMSSLPVEQLPRSFLQGGAKMVCAVESVLSPLDMKLKNRHWYNRGPRYLRAEFDVNVIIGAADLKFQMIGKNGVVSRGHEEVEVQWTLSTDQRSYANAPQENYGMYQDLRR